MPLSISNSAWFYIVKPSLASFHNPDRQWQLSTISPGYNSPESYAEPRLGHFRLPWSSGRFVILMLFMVSQLWIKNEFISHRLCVQCCQMYCDEAVLICHTFSVYLHLKCSSSFPQGCKRNYMWDSTLEQIYGEEESLVLRHWPHASMSFNTTASCPNRGKANSITAEHMRKNYDLLLKVSAYKIENSCIIIY